MSDKTTHDDDKPSAPSASLVFTIVGTVVDTTWRLFFPTIGGTVLGIWADHSFETKPWFTVLGVIGGTLCAFGLVYMQIRKVRS